MPSNSDTRLLAAINTLDEERLDALIIQHTHLLQDELDVLAPTVEARRELLRVWVTTRIPEQSVEDAIGWGDEDDTQLTIKQEAAHRLLEYQRKLTAGNIQEIRQKLLDYAVQSSGTGLSAEEVNAAVAEVTAPSGDKPKKKKPKKRARKKVAVRNRR